MPVRRDTSLMFTESRKDSSTIYTQLIIVTCLQTFYVSAGAVLGIHYSTILNVYFKLVFIPLLSIIAGIGPSISVYFEQTCRHLGHLSQLSIRFFLISTSFSTRSSHLKRGLPKRRFAGRIFLNDRYRTVISRYYIFENTNVPEKFTYTVVKIDDTTTIPIINDVPVRDEVGLFQYVLECPILITWHFQCTLFYIKQ